MCFCLLARFVDSCSVYDFSYFIVQVNEAPITIDDNDEDSESPLASRKVGRTGRRRVKDLSVSVLL